MESKRSHEDLAYEISYEISQAIGALSLADDMFGKLEKLDDIVYQAALIKRALSETSEKAQALSGNLSMARIEGSPIDELENKILESIRVLRRSAEGEKELLRALYPLFALASEKIEGFSLPAWMEKMSKTDTPNGQLVVLSPG